MIDIKTFAISQQGYGHIIKGLPCQDYSLAKKYPNYVIATVCDGHGGDKYFRSQRGSKFAAEVFDSVINEFFLNNFECFSTKKKKKKKKKIANGDGVFLEKKFYNSLDQLIKNFIYKWREKVYSDWHSDPFKMEELSTVNENDRHIYLDDLNDSEDSNVYSAYGTTFIGACLTDSLCFGFQIGDGDLFAMDSYNNFFRLVEDDPKIMGSMTTSLCGNTAFQDARKFVIQKSDEHFPVAVFVSSDGVLNSFENENNIFDFYRQIMTELATSDTFENELKCALDELSEKGSRDDVSVSGIIDVRYWLSICK